MNGYIVFDLEATCWEMGCKLTKKEIIEIGAVYVNGKSFEPISEFSAFVRPIEEPILSDFCINLTTISQSEVDSAKKFPEVLNEFLSWIGPLPVIMGSWGDYDIKQIKIDCDRHEIPFPDQFKRHVNLKKTFAGVRRIKPCGMKKALKKAGIALEGTHHRGIDDARNISKLLQYIAQHDKSRLKYF